MGPVSTRGEVPRLYHDRVALGFKLLSGLGEKAFARLKALLRKAAERTVSGLWGLIGKLVDLFQPGECANYFRAAGYEPD